MEAPNVVSACVMTQAQSVLDFALSINPPGGNGCCLLEFGLKLEIKVSIICTELIRSQRPRYKYLGTYSTNSRQSTNISSLDFIM